MRSISALSALACSGLADKSTARFIPDLVISDEAGGLAIWVDEALPVHDFRIDELVPSEATLDGLLGRLLRPRFGSDFAILLVPGSGTLKTGLGLNFEDGNLLIHVLGISQLVEY